LIDPQKSNKSFKTDPARLSGQDEQPLQRFGKEDVQPFQLGKYIEQMLYQMKAFNHKLLDLLGRTMPRI
jgi:hypothetical protein